MRFAYPHLLWLLALLPLLGLLGLWALAWRARVAMRLGDPAMLERLCPAAVGGWRRMRMCLVLGAIALMTLSAARPQYGRIEQTIDTAAASVILAIDVSPSMKARDVAPDRLERARMSLRLFLTRLAGQRIGIIAFAGEAILQCPLTTDMAMARLVLESLDIDSIAVAGTDIGAAIRVGGEAFENDASPGGRVLVLMTDGEDHEGGVIEAAAEAARREVIIYSIGIGTPGGAPLHEERGGFKTDPDGGFVTTRLQLPVLERIGRMTGGEAWAAGDAPERAVDAVIAAIDRQRKERLESRRLVIHQDRFQWFLAPALVLLLMAVLSRPDQTD